MLRLEARAESSILMSYASPLIAIVLMLFGGLLLFTFLGKDPIEGFKIFFDAIKIQDHQDKWEEEESPPQLGWEISNVDELNARATNNEFRT